MTYTELLLTYRIDKDNLVKKGSYTDEVSSYIECFESEGVKISIYPEGWCILRIDDKEVYQDYIS